MSSTRVYGPSSSLADNKASRSYVPTVFQKFPVRWQALRPGIPEPIKRLESDAGWEICLVGRTGNRLDDEVNAVNLYDTGIRCAPPPGFYLELIATQELYKHGYCLPSGGVHYQPEDWEEIVVPLVKMSDGDDIETPFNGIRIVPKRVEYCHLIKVTDVDTSDLVGDIGTPGAPTIHNAPQQFNQFQPQQRDPYNSQPPVQQQRNGRRPMKTNHMY